MFLASGKALGIREGSKRLGVSIETAETDTTRNPGQASQYCGGGKKYFQAVPESLHVYEYARMFLKLRLNACMLMSCKRLLSEAPSPP
jgi:hypothetical protein